MSNEGGHSLYEILLFSLQALFFYQGRLARSRTMVEAAPMMSSSLESRLVTWKWTCKGNTGEEKRDGENIFHA